MKVASRTNRLTNLGIILYLSVKRSEPLIEKALYKCLLLLLSETLYFLNMPSILVELHYVRALGSSRPVHPDNKTQTKVSAPVI